MDKVAEVVGVGVGGVERLQELVEVFVLLGDPVLKAAVEKQRYLNKYYSA